MKDFDQKIAEALNADQADEFRRLGAEPSLAEMVFQTYRGRHRWLMVLMSVFQLAFFVAAIWCAVRFFNQTDVRYALYWGLGVVMFMFAMSFIKLWFWLEIEKNAVIREVKRVELQVASLADRLAGHD